MRAARILALALTATLLGAPAHAGTIDGFEDTEGPDRVHPASEPVSPEELESSEEPESPEELESPEEPESSEELESPE